MNIVGIDKSTLYQPLWQRPTAVRVLWMTLLFLADDDGFIDASLPALAKYSGLTLDQVRESLDVLLGPEPYADDLRAYQGRQISEVDRGWRLNAHERFRRRRRRPRTL
jgi:hypothetical protein